MAVLNSLNWFVRVLIRSHLIVHIMRKLTLLMLQIIPKTYIISCQISAKDIFQIYFMRSKILQMYESWTVKKRGSWLEESAWSETQLSLRLGLIFMLPKKQTWQLIQASTRSKIFPIIIDDRLVGSIRLFWTIDYEISADSQHYWWLFKIEG